MQSTGINLIIKERAVEVGQDLRKLREQKELTLEEISEELKIRKFYLEKIEDGDIQNIPGIAYQRMYLKTYCKYLDLPLEYNTLGAPANENLQSAEGFKALNRNTPNGSQNHIPSKATIVVCAVLLLILLFFWGGTS